MILFTKEDTTYRLPGIRETRRWLTAIIEGYEKRLGEITVVFCSDAYLLKINQESLQHNDYTDIITFDYCVDDWVSGDLFVSVPRVQDNAKKYGVSQREEMARVLVHGVLHLIGFQDKTTQTQAAMREAENRALAQLFHVKH
ncbi:MAG: rRNA maturation RNase YbeY [Flavobacteriales bacterium]